MQFSRQIVKEIILTDVKTTIKPKIVQVEDVAKLLINVLYFSKNPLERLSEREGKMLSGSYERM